MAPEKLMIAPRRVCAQGESSPSQVAAEDEVQRSATFRQFYNIAHTLGQTHKVTMVGKHKSLLTPLLEQEARLAYFFNRGDIIDSSAIATCHCKSQADDYALLANEIRRAKESASRCFGRSLPRLTNNGSVGQIRVYAVARAFVSVTPISIDSEVLALYLSHYQRSLPLSLRELYILPEMLRLALIEALAEMSIELEFQEPHAAVAAPDLAAFRALDQIDWAEIIDCMSIASPAESWLRQDPSKDYLRMDWRTRDDYRAAVSSIANRTTSSISSVAALSLLFAQEAAQFHGVEDVRAHVGFYILGPGRRTVEKALISNTKGAVKIFLTISTALGDTLRRRAFNLYAAATMVLTLLLTSVVLFYGYGSNFKLATSVMVTLLTTFVLNHFAIYMIGALANRKTEPRCLPRMDFSGGIPTTCRTVVTVPAMLSSMESTEDLFRMLERRFLGNHDPMISFCLLTDFPDAPKQSMPTDDALLRHAVFLTKHLNTKYCGEHNNPFLLLHRPRRWNDHDKIWMGYERKRGKLIDLNALLRGSGGRLFSSIIGDTGRLVDVKYVITLDADTLLPDGAAQRMIAAISHPLNRPRYCEAAGRVVAGYGILQPSLTVSRPNGGQSWYKILGYGDPELSQSASPRSDFYQYLFGEATFYGKGIYDIDAFTAAVHDRFPQNRILSHDLIEGCYARVGMLSDVESPEEFPPNYHADTKRRHRWMRGDTQIAEWIFPFVPAGCSAGSSKVAGKIRNYLPFLARWKIAGNLRRIFLPSAFTLQLLFAWFDLSSATAATWLVILVLAAPLLDSLLCENKLIFLGDISIKPKWKRSLLSTIRHSLQFVLVLAFLPFEGMLGIDAFIRSMWRITMSHSLLLEWEPSSEANRKTSNRLCDYVRLMWIGPSISCLTILCLLVFRRSSAFAVAAPLLVLWFASPLIAWLISRPTSEQR